MKFSRKIAIGAAAAVGLAAGVAIAQPGQMDGAKGKHGQMGGMQHGQMGGMQHGQMGGMQHGQKDGMQHGQMGGMGHGPKSGMGQGRKGAQQSMTPEERQSRRAEVHRHAPEQGVAPKAPANSESSN